MIQAKVLFDALPLAALAALAVAPAVVQANLIQNGSFEDPGLADGTIQATTPASWSGGAAMMNPNASGGLAGNPFTWPQAADGEQYEDIGNEPRYALAQSFLVGAADTYLLTWQDNTGLNIGPGFQTAPYSVALRNAAGDVVVSRALDSYHADGAWVARSIVQALVVGRYTLVYTSLNSFNQTDTLIDAVSLVVAPAIPEPASALLLLLGLGGMYAVARVSRRSGVSA